jgi:hypothetical protein
MFNSPHNLVTVPKNAENRYGIRVSLAGNDPFRSLLADGWETFHWFADADERNRALADMSRRHEFSRMGDTPTVCFEPLNP